MTQSDSIFGAELDRLKRLLTVGEEEPEEGSSAHTPRTASLGILTERPGGRIGHYKLLSVLGEGGMGIVYLAEQAQPIRRQVALKVIKPGMDSARVIARFEAERQALALLDHPNIAHVYDAGTTEAGRLYFVMEYVKGLPITEHCDRHKLTIEERLGLFLQVCHAVQHAHQKGIIHRDIKPSNILVSITDDQAVPKIIDFGVAKAVSQPLTERTLITEQGQLFGTPEYMSPEQADMANEDIDTRSDIYSLGVLLYVLLTGVLPFDSATFREGGIDHIRRIIHETDPKTPSTRLSSLGDEANDIAQKRGAEVATLARRLHKELEWIPLMAMRKDRAERYRSVSELADDIGNYLKGTPLIAGPPSTVYRLKKFVRRNRALVTGIAAVLVVLVAGVIVSTLFAISAERKARTAQAISDFFSNDVLAAIDPLTGEKPVASLEPILDIAMQRLDGKFEDEPLVEASIRYTLGRRYWHIGKFDAAEVNLKRAVDLGRKKLATDDRQLLIYTQELAWVYGYQSRNDEAKALLLDTVDRMERALDEVDWSLQRAKNRLAWLYLHNFGRHEQAEKLWTELLEVIQRRLGPDHPDAAGHMEGLVAVYMAQGRLEEAEEVAMKALEIARSAYGPEHNTTLINMVMLSRVYKALGRYNETEDLYVKALEIRRRTLGEEHFKTLDILSNLGSLYREMERYDDAERLLVPALEMRRRIFGEKGYATLHSMIEVARLFRNQGHYERAEPLLLEAEQTARRAFGNDHKITNASVNDLIKLYDAWGKPEKAKEWRAKLPQIEAVEE